MLSKTFFFLGAKVIENVLFWAFLGFPAGLRRVSPGRRRERLEMRPGRKSNGKRIVLNLPEVFCWAERTSKFGPSEKKVNILFEPREHFFISKKGGGAEGAAPFFAL